MVRGDNSLFFSTALDNSGLRSGALDAVGIIKGLGGQISKLNPFAALAVGAISAFTVISNGAYNMARDFEQAMKEVQTISAAAQDDFKGISSEVFSLSEITPDNPQQLAKAYYQIVSAGYDGAKGMKLLEVSAKAAVAGVTDTQTAADGITTILNAFKISAEQSEEVADSLFNTVKLGKTTFSELASNISQVGPIAAASNIPLNEILSSVASLTKQGVPTAQAMTQIRSAIVGLQESGRLDGTKTFQENLQSLYDTFNGNQTAIQKEVGRIEAVQAILGVAGKNAKSANEDLKTYNETIGATQRAFNDMASSNINQWAILRNRIKATTESLGNSILEMSSGIAGFFNEALKGSSLAEKQYKRESQSLNDLKLELQDTSVPMERRKDIITELQQKYPSYLQNITNEGILTDELKTALSGVNSQLLQRFKLEANKEKAGETALAIGEKETEQLEAQKAARREIDAISKKSAAAREVLNKLEGRSITDQVDALKELSTAQFRYLDLYTEKIKNPGKELIELRNQFKELTGQQEDLANGLVDFNITGDDDGNKDALDANLGDFQDFLDKKRSEYESYENYVNQLGAEKAKERYKELLKEGDNYAAFLQDQLNRTKDYERERAIVDAAAREGVQLLQREQVQKIKVEIQPIVEDVKVDTTSIKFIERQIDLINKKWKEANEKNRPEIKIQLDYWRGRLAEVNKGVNAEKDLYSDMHRSITDLTVKELNKYIEYWEKRLQAAREGSDAYIEIENRIASATLKINEKLINQSSQLMSEASRLFSSIGQGGLADVIDDLNEVGTALGNTLNKLNNDNSTGLEKATSVVGLFVTAYDKLIKLNKELNNKGLNRQIDMNKGLLQQIEIEQEINRLHRERNELMRNSSVLLDSFYKDNYNAAAQAQVDAVKTIESSMQSLLSGALLRGTGKTSGFFGIGAKNKDFNFNLNDILGFMLGDGKVPSSINQGTKTDAFFDVVKSVEDVLRGMGKTVADVARFSSEEWNEFFHVLDASGRITEESTKELFETFKNASQEYQQALEDMRDIISDVAGDLGGDLKNSLVSAFTAGEDAALSFRNSISEILQNLFLEELINTQFRSYFEQLQKEMEGSFGAGGDQSWIDDIKRFSENISPQMQAALDAMEAFNNDLVNQGFEGFKGERPSGLAGAISTITEDTANILAGTLNSIRIDVANGLIVAENSSRYLLQISENTAYNRLLESIDIKMGNIESSLNQFESQGL